MIKKITHNLVKRMTVFTDLKIAKRQNSDANLLPDLFCCQGATGTGTV